MVHEVMSLQWINELKYAFGFPKIYWPKIYWAFLCAKASRNCSAMTVFVALGSRGFAIPKHSYAHSVELPNALLHNHGGLERVEFRAVSGKRADAEDEKGGLVLSHRVAVWARQSALPGAPWGVEWERPGIDTGVLLRDVLNRGRQITSVFNCPPQPQNT